MLYTNLKHIESVAKHVDLINEYENIMVICGRMEPRCILVYRIAEELEEEYPNMKFYDMEYDHPELNEVCNHSEFSDFVEIPYIIYYKKGVVVNTTSGTRTKAEIKRILDKEFVPTVTDTKVNYELNIHTCSQLGCEIKPEVTRSLDLNGDDRQLYRR